jgi:hypothetical protein
MSDEHDPDGELLGSAALWLYEQGDHDLAAALVNVRRAVYVHISYPQEGYDVYLEVDGATAAILKQDALDKVRTALDLLGRPTCDRYFGVTAVPARVEGDWRAIIKNRFTAKPSNQARKVMPGMIPFLYEDGMAFRSDPELGVYRALRRAQASLPPHETIGILPNPSMRVAGHTWEPDFLVSYRNRIGVIEVDGPHHGQRYASDKTKDLLYEDTGVAYVLRIPVEDTDNQVVAGVIERFLQRLRQAS